MIQLAAAAIVFWFVIIPVGWLVGNFLYFCHMAMKSIREEAKL